MPPVKNAHLLELIFGRWPSFHDAEIHSIVLTRDRTGAPQNRPRLEATIHVWEMTPEVDDKGFYVLKDHTMVTLAFDSITDLSLNGFNHQNVLWDLEIVQELCEQVITVTMPTSYGCEAKFKCESIEVVSAVPYPVQKSE